MRKLFYISFVLLLTLSGCFEKEPEPTQNHYLNAKIGTTEWKTKQVGASLESDGRFGIVGLGDDFSQFQILIGFPIKQGDSYTIRATTLDNTNSPNILINYISITKGAFSSASITEQRGLGSQIGKVTITELTSKEIKGSFECKIANSQGVTNVEGQFYSNLSK